MVTLHPQYITDTTGGKMVVLPIDEYNSIIDELEEIEDMRLYDEAKNNDTGERIPMHEAFKIIEAKRKNEA
jgi:PHD/YefM family antitoxin component YafN of YafNO toxin-antitoxin module